MSTNRSSSDLRQLLRTAAPPVLALSALVVVGEVSPLDAWTTTLETSRRVATALAVLWFVIATGTAGYRTRRDAHAHQRLQNLRDLATEPNRALAYLQTIVWRAAAGQQAVVVNVATGVLHPVWLPELSVPLGAFVVLERTNSGVSVVDWMNARQVEEAHSYERRHHITNGSGDVNLLRQERRNDAVQLIEETEQYLREQEPRGSL